jgi:cell wall-associated NlpC family hydrolase
VKGLRLGILVSAVALGLLAPATAEASVPAPRDTPTWARAQVLWTLNQGWLGLSGDGLFHPGRPATRLAAAKVVVNANAYLNHLPASDDPYGQAVAAGWFGAGSGPYDTITQLEFDRGMAHILHLVTDSQRLNTLHSVDGWKPALPTGFGAEQLVRSAGARYNAPYGADQWETWPSSTLTRTMLAVEAYELAHRPSYWQNDVDQTLGVTAALPAYTPLQKAVVTRALQAVGAPYVWGGTSAQQQVVFGKTVSGGFDCSGFVWWVLKLHTYHLPDGSTWSGNSAISYRSTYDMAAHLPAGKRVTRANLRPGDVLFWSSAPKGVYTNYTTVYHAGIYLGNGWAINSHGGGAGVTLDYMGTGAYWFHDAFAFGWHVLPAGK